MVRNLEEAMNIYRGMVRDHLIDKKRISRERNKDYSILAIPSAMIRGMEIVLHLSGREIDAVWRPLEQELGVRRLKYR
ncbi:MAG: hypothetical protein PHF44_02940 [Candidatus Pacebacteria bacterium]|nr:hypothetical protein [Candidatus Paceibacterota bacterium]